MLADRFSGGRVERLMESGEDGKGGEVGEMVRRFEEECEKDGESWLERPKGV